MTEQQRRVRQAACRLIVGGATGDDLLYTEAVNDLLLPVVKGYGSERAWVVLGTESLQTLGGSGFLEDYPIAQYVRDSKIDTLYEGTTAIQGLDLFFRKIVKDRGRALEVVCDEAAAFVASEAGNGRLKVERRLLATALGDLSAIVATMTDRLAKSDPHVEGGDIHHVYEVGLNTTRLLMAFGDVVCGYLLLRQAEVALLALAGGPNRSDAAFYEGKVVAAQFFARTVLPGLSAERAIAETTDQLAMDLPEAAF